MSNFTRREILSAFLGAPVAIAAGCGTTPRLPAQGEIVGASNELGHRIRRGDRPQPAADRWSEVDVVIVGGGIAGLSAAWRLERAGFRNYVLLELEPVAGGTSRSGDMKRIPCPWGAHYIPVPLSTNRPLIALLEEIGVVEGNSDDGEPIIGEQYLCRDPEERVFVDGSWHEGLFPYEVCTRDDIAQLESFQREIDRWAATRDGKGRRAFAIPLADSADDPEMTVLDGISMSEWLAERKLTSARLRWLIDYSCRDDYGLTVDQTSAWAGLFYFASRIRKAGDHAQPLITWPEGNGRLVEHFLSTAGDRCRVGRLVTEIIRKPVDAGEHVEIVAVDAAGSVEGFRARCAIFAAPQFLAPHLIRGYREERGDIAAAFDYGSWMVANLYLKDRPASNGFALSWDNVIYDSHSLGYVVATHQQGRDYGPTVLTYYYPLCGDDPRAERERLLSMDWSDCAEVVLSDLERAHPKIRGLVERLDVMRWGHAMVRPKPGFIWGSERRSAADPYGPVHFANTDLSGVALFEEAFYHGNRAGEEVLRALGRQFGEN